MALHQSEMAKAEAMRNSAAAVSNQKLSIMRGQESHLLSFVTLDNPVDNTINYGEGYSFQERGGSSNKGYRSGKV